MIKVGNDNVIGECRSAVTTANGDALPTVAAFTKPADINRRLLCKRLPHRIFSEKQKATIPGI